MTTKTRKILILVDWFYPGYKAGGPIQSCRNFIAAMEGDFEISVISSDRDLGDSQPYPGIMIDEWNSYTSRTKVFYASALSVHQLKQLLEKESPDFIYLNSMFSVRFAIFPLWLLWRNKIKAKLVLAPRGMLQRGALQFKSNKKGLFTRFIKSVGLPQKITFHATDEQEGKDIRAFFPRAAEVAVASNFPKMSQPAFIPVEKKINELSCVFISRVSRKKNISFFLSLLANVPENKKISFQIRGEIEDRDYWKSCLGLIDRLPPNIIVFFGGPIENDKIASFLQEHHLFVLPTLGENFGHAIFEAFAAGRPVLISDQTPWRQLAQKKAGWDLPLGDKSAFLAQLVEIAAMPQIEWDQWCQGAWQLANNFIHKTDIKQPYLKLFN